MDTPFVSVVILNYNGKEYLETCLNSVLKTAYDEFEVILVDNNSTDGSLDYVRRNFQADKRLKIVALNKNYGFALGNNIGYHHVNPRSKYVIFLNNDIEVEANWIHEIIKKMEQDHLIGAAQPKIMYFSDRRKISAVGGTIDYYGRAFHIGDGETDRGQYNSISQIFYAQGAAIALRKEVLEKVGLFDPSFFAYYEETDLCWRIWLAGYKVILVPSAVVYHWCGATIKREMRTDIKKAIRFGISYRRRNQLIMMLKNYSILNIPRYVLPFAARMLAVAVLRFAKGEFSEGIAYAEALWSVLININEIVKKRQRVQRKIRKLPDSEVMKLMRSPTG